MLSTVKVLLSVLLFQQIYPPSESSVLKSSSSINNNNNQNGLPDININSIVNTNPSKSHSVINKKVYPTVETVVGSSVELPCNSSSPTDDSVQLILWFKSAYGTGPPFLKLDARLSTSLETASLTIESEFADRVYFNTTSSPTILHINPVREEDSSIYSCRVDYKWSRTSISNINLFIIVPPHDVIISDPSNGLRLGPKAGPYSEGSLLKLNCLAIGGKPSPHLVWYLDNQLIDDSFTIDNETSNVVNELIIDPLKRSHPDSVLTCKATNHIAIPPISASTRLELYLRPLEVNIYPKKPLRAGQKAELTCESKGAKPTTKLTWFINGHELKDARSIESVDEGTTSTSIVSFTPMVSHNGLPLICRAENPKIINSSLYDNWFLQVYFRPKVALNLTDENQKAIIYSQIKMQCDIKANPNATEIHWLFNNETLKSDASQGIRIDNSTLILNISSTGQAGKYECLAKNSEGTGKSNQIDLKIHHEPTCSEPDFKVIYEIPMGETVNISCNINPRAVNVTFWWKFTPSLQQNQHQHDSSDSERTVFYNKSASKKSKSSSSSFSSSSFVPSPSSLTKTFTRNKVIQYQVNLTSDYGLLLCGLDSKSVQHDKTPNNQCQFQIKPSTALPYPPENCHLLENSSDSSYLIECSKSSKSTPWKETYFLEVHDQDNLSLRPTASSSSSSSLSSPIVMINDDQPHFKIAISELPSNESTTFVIYSQNGVGKSSQIYLSMASHRMLQSKASNPELNHLYKSLLFPFIGFISIFGLIGLSTYALRCKRRKSMSTSDNNNTNNNNNHTSNNNNNDSKTSPSLSLKSNKISPKSSKIRTPDVIPLRINDSVNEVITLNEKWSKEDVLLMDKNETILATQLDDYNRLSYPDYSGSNIHVQLIAHPNDAVDDLIHDQDKMANKSDDCLNDGQFIPVLIQFQEHHQHLMKDTSNPISLMETRLPMTGDIQPYSMSTPV